MDLIEKLASLAQRYEELNTMMGRQEVLDDISLLQRYGREHPNWKRLYASTTS